MVCNVEKEMIKGRKVIKQMLNKKKYNFPLTKAVVVPMRISYTIQSSLKGFRGILFLFIWPLEKKPNPLREAWIILFITLVCNVHYILSVQTLRLRSSVFLNAYFGRGV